MNNQNNNNNVNGSFSNSGKTPPKDLLTLSSSIPKKASISNNTNNVNSNNKFIISNQDFNNINTNTSNNVSQSNNNTLKQNITNNSVNNLVQQPVNNNNIQTQPSTNKFITDDSNTSVKNVNIGSKSIFNVSNNQNMTLNSNNNTYPNYNNGNINTNNMANNTNNSMNNNNQITQASININEEKQKQKTDNLMKKTFVPLVELEHKTKKQNKLFFGILIGSVVVFIIVISIALFSSGTKFSFFGGSPYYTDVKHEKTGEGETYVAVENTYKNVDISTKEEAHELIKEDSENQKQRCRDKLGMKYEKVEQMEKKLEKEYNIVAVNLCEMDIDYLINLEKKLKKLYQEFPMLKNCITNLSIANSDYLGDGVLASFNPADKFATSKSLLKSSVWKTRIYLNAQDFLDVPSLKETVKSNASTGRYIPNADEYSVVIHEFGHYLSFIATLNNNNKKIDSTLLRNNKNAVAWGIVVNDFDVGDTSLQILEEALQNYITNPKYRKNSSLYSGSVEESVDKFRLSISEYANSYDDKGNPIYDEAIAEAFHDYFVNGEKGAKAQSMEVVKVLKKYLGM